MLYSRFLPHDGVEIKVNSTPILGSKGFPLLAARRACLFRFLCPPSPRGVRGRKSDKSLDGAVDLNSRTVFLGAVAPMSSPLF